MVSPILQMGKLIDGYEEVPGKHRGRNQQLHKEPVSKGSQRKVTSHPLSHSFKLHLMSY